MNKFHYFYTALIFYVFLNPLKDKRMGLSEKILSVILATNKKPTYLLMDVKQG